MYYVNVMAGATELDGREWQQPSQQNGTDGATIASATEWKYNGMGWLQMGCNI